MFGNVIVFLGKFKKTRSVTRRYEEIGRKFLATGVKGTEALAGSQKPERTSVRYKVTRGPYASVNDAHLRFLEDILGKERLLTDPDECQSYNVDWVKMVRGGWKLVGVLLIRDAYAAEPARLCGDGILTLEWEKREGRKKGRS